MPAVTSALAVLATLFSIASSQTPPSFSPSTDAGLVVTYPGLAPFSAGARLPLEGVQTAPAIALPPDFPTPDPSTLFFIFLLDPDAPSKTNTSLANILHWGLPSLHTTPGRDGALTSDASPISTYIGALPSAGSGPHDYTFLLYEQPQKVFVLPSVYEGLGSGEGRGKNITKFDLDLFLQRTGLGDLVGGTYFVAENGTLGEEGGEGGKGGEASATVVGSGMGGGVKPTGAVGGGGGMVGINATGSFSAGGGGAGGAGGVSSTATEAEGNESAAGGAAGVSSSTVTSVVEGGSNGATVTEAAGNNGAGGAGATAGNGGNIGPSPTAAPSPTAFSSESRHSFGTSLLLTGIFAVVIALLMT